MSRRKEIKAQQIDSYKLHFSKQSDKEIHLRLAEFYDEKTVSIRTVKKWTSKFKKLDSALVKDDAEFEWNKCDEHAIPWPQSRRMIDMAYEYTLRNKHILPSWREVKWWTRISQTMPDMDDFEIMQLADAYVKREWSQIIDDVILNFQDLDGYLIYQPYRGEQEGQSRKEGYAEFLKRIYPEFNSGS